MCVASVRYEPDSCPGDARSQWAASEIWLKVTEKVIMFLFVRHTNTESQATFSILACMHFIYSFTLYLIFFSHLQIPSCPAGHSVSPRLPWPLHTQLELPLLLQQSDLCAIIDDAFCVKAATLWNSLYLRTFMQLNLLDNLNLNVFLQKATKLCIKNGTNGPNVTHIKWKDLWV